MSPWRRRLRVFALVWGVLQLALPLAALFGDAESALRGAARNGAHIEATSSAACTPAHADECALCRFLSNNNATPPCADGGLIAAAAASSPKPELVSPSIVVARRLPESRAPPVA